MKNISICVGSSCHLKGSYKIIELAKDYIANHNIGDKVNLGAAFCLGRCTDGVTIKIDDEIICGVNENNFQQKVFATPAMIALIEKAACKALEGQLEDGQTTVGTKLDVAHVAATPVGMNVTAEAVLTEIDNRRLVFEVVARDEKDIIGKGIHERFIVNAEKFTAKTYGKV